jgi:hypothetical protein
MQGKWIVTVHKRTSTGRGWKKIRTIRVPRTEDEIVIYLASEGNKFMAEVSGVEFRDTDVSVVESKAKEAVLENIDIEWQRVVQVELGTSWSWTRGKKGSVEIDYEVFWVTKKPMIDEHYRRADHNNFEEYNTPAHLFGRSRPMRDWNLKKDGLFEPPCCNETGNMITLPYTKETVEALDFLIDEISKLKGKLAEFLARPNAISYIRSKMPLALPIPEDNDE